MNAAVERVRTNSLERIAGAVPLDDLITHVRMTCLMTSGRLRRLNRYLFGIDLIMELAPPQTRKDVEARLLAIAYECDFIRTDDDAEGGTVEPTRAPQINQYPLIG